MTAIVISLIIVTQSSQDASNLDPMSQEIFVTFWKFVGFLQASFDRGLPQWCVLVNQSVAEVDCEDHVVPPVKFLEPYDSNQSAASLTLHENDAVHVQLTSAVLAHRRQTAKKKDHPNLLPVLEVALEQRTAMHRVWVASRLRSPISINQESEDNIELLPLYHVPCVTLWYSVTALVKQHSRNDRQKKKNCQMSVYYYYKADPGELIQWAPSIKNAEDSSSESRSAESSEITRNNRTALNLSPSKPARSSQKKIWRRLRERLSRAARRLDEDSLEIHTVHSGKNFQNFGQA